jgi:hypothetical protein
MKMSIGEIINMYKDEEIVIRPEFQRLFRWDIEQKSRFIESILIGIPIPPIFVQQRKDGVWEVVDGLQRISTLLQFVGELKDENGQLRKPEPLVKTKFLPHLDGMYLKYFEDIPESKNNHFSKEIQLVFKRTPLQMIIIKRESDETTKYELFDRLNSGGTPLTEQEIRNAIFLIEKPYAIELIHKLSKQENFVNSTALTEKNIEEAYDEELVLRFFAYTEIPNLFRKYNSSVKDFLDGYLREHIKEEDILMLENKFNKFFNFMERNFGENSFRKFNIDKNKYWGGFNISKYEALVIGLKDKFDELELNEEKFKEKIKNLEKQDWFNEAIKGRSFARKRIDIFLKEATSYFKV